MRPTAWISTASRKGGPGRGLRLRYMGAAMWTNGRGTNSVKPPVSACRARVRSRCRAQCRGDSTWPNMMVMLERSPTEWATRWTSSHSSVVTLSGQMTARTSSSRIWGAGPGRRAAPAGGPLGDLEGGEAVDVHGGHGVVDGLGHVQVVVAVEAGVDATL